MPPVHTERFDPLEAERLERAYSDKNALQRVWGSRETEPPREDLEIFFDNLSGDGVLDVGCGWGYYVYEFLDRGLHYRGIDISPEMIKIAQESNPEAKFSIMSYRELQFQADAFDGLWCSCVFGGEPKHNMPNVLAELKRVLKPGGIMTIVMPITWGSVDELAHDQKGNVIGWHACYEPGELHQLIESVGFSRVWSFDRRMHGAASVMVRK